MGRSWKQAVRNTPLLFEPVPLGSRVNPSRSAQHFESLVRLIREVPRLDAVDIPELVDENHEGQPYYRSGDVRAFGRKIQELTDREAIVNKVVAHLPDLSSVADWTEETVRSGLKHVIFVGGSSRYIPYPGPSVIEADARCRSVVQDAGGSLGNIAIPQRAGEAHRMLAKARSGAEFFTTQILFDSEAVLQVLQDYDHLCRQSGLEPATVLLSLAPIGDETDAEFIRWLGGDFPEEAERAILEGEESEAGARSIAHALRIWSEVREGVRSREIAIPLGVNVEQLSQRNLPSAAAMLAAFARELTL
jgi:5,10-methylenetetrahydrofolate reductase